MRAGGVEFPARSMYGKLGCRQKLWTPLFLPVFADKWINLFTRNRVQVHSFVSGTIVNQH